jgi:hypothetical protein
MPPKNYSFWDQLMAEQGVTAGFDPAGPDVVLLEASPNFNVGDVIVGEIVEEG